MWKRSATGQWVKATKPYRPLLADGAHPPSQEKEGKGQKGEQEQEPKEQRQKPRAEEPGSRTRGWHSHPSGASEGASPASVVHSAAGARREAGGEAGSLQLVCGRQFGQGTLEDAGAEGKGYSEELEFASELLAGAQAEEEGT